MPPPGATPRAPRGDPAVAADLVQPGLEQHAIALFTLAADQAHPGVLKHLFGQSMLATQAEQKAKQAEPVALIQLGKSRRITAAVTPHQGGVVIREGSIHCCTRAVVERFVAVCRLCVSSTSCTNSPRKPKRSSPLAARASSALSARLKRPV